MSKGVHVQNTIASTMNAKESVVLNSECIGLNGAVKALSIVVKNIQAENYSTGMYGKGYNSATHNTDDGSSDTGNNEPDWGGGGVNNRHCTAWEQIKPALDLICGMLDCLTGKVGCPSTTDEVRALANRSKMPRNRGE